MTTEPGDGPSPYPPASFQEGRAEVLTAAIRQIVFGHLITIGPDGPVASAAPFVLRDGPEGISLEAHLARANPQSLAAGVAALVLFQGPQAYVRPGWYPSKARDGRAVPTWNYISVQAKGRLKVIDDGVWLKAHLAAISVHQEGRFADPWSPADGPEDYIAGLSRGVVGVRLSPTVLTGVWKLNHPLENRLGVVAGLRALGDKGSNAIAVAIEAEDLKS
jgi:transcriptional regulator